MSAYDYELALGKNLMSAIVDPASCTVRTSSLASLESTLASLGLLKISDVEYGPPGGRQIFYRNGKVVVRVKTKGDAAGFRANQPHLSAALTDGNGLDWFNELAKFNYQGQLAAKAMTTADRFKPADHQGNSQRFVVIMGDQYDGPGPDAWAQRTHFTFPGNNLTA
jgi:hypothetical protein